MPFVIGLTGGIGSGKSAAADEFARLGATLVDTDAIAHALTAPGGAAIDAVRTLFGDSAIDASGAMDRAWVRARVFADPDARRRLEAVLHPLIRRESSARVRAAPGPYVVLVVPLLVESQDYRARVDRVLVVDCPVELQVADLVRVGADGRRRVRQRRHCVDGRGQRFVLVGEFGLPTRPGIFPHPCRIGRLGTTVDLVAQVAEVGVGLVERGGHATHSGMTRALGAVGHQPGGLHQHRVTVLTPERVAGQSGQELVGAGFLVLDLEGTAIKPGLPENPAVVHVDQKLFQHQGAEMHLLGQGFAEIAGGQCHHDVGDGKSLLSQAQCLIAPLAVLSPAAVIGTGVCLRRENGAVIAEPANPHYRHINHS